MTVNSYKIAPTFLYNVDGESRAFLTQEAVDDAWDRGWFGPPWLVTKKGLISTEEFPTKADLSRAVEADPRYAGLSINVKKSYAELMTSIKEFEIENELEEFIEE